MRRNTDDNIADAMPHTPVMASYRCAAHGCPMTGAIFEHSAGGAGICAYHYGSNTTDWTRITRALTDWECVTREIRECRRVHMDPSTKPEDLDRLFKAAAARVEPLVGAWWSDLKPGGESYRDWGHGLEYFIGKRVVGEMTRRKSA